MKPRRNRGLGSSPAAHERNAEAKLRDAESLVGHAEKANYCSAALDALFLVGVARGQLAGTGMSIDFATPKQQALLRKSGAIEANARQAVLKTCGCKR